MRKRNRTMELARRGFFLFMQPVVLEDFSNVDVTIYNFSFSFFHHGRLGHGYGKKKCIYFLTLSLVVYKSSEITISTRRVLV